MINKFLENPYRIFNVLAAHRLFNWVPDKLYLKLRYRATFRRKLDLENPKTFNEKLQWLKLNNRKYIYSTMVDKAEAKHYVAERIGKKYIISTLGIWDSFDKIDFSQLPNRFVLKCTHDSGGVVICKDKKQFNHVKARNIIKKAMKNNYYKWGREWPYKNVKPRIIAETYLEDALNEGLTDYKIHCFNGRAKVILVCTNRYSNDGLKQDFFDEEWNHLDLGRPTHPRANIIIKKPSCLDEMLNLAERLSDGIPFIRVDFYEIDNKVYFSELTFFPASGLQPFSPEEWDYKMGEWISLHSVI